MYTQPLFHRKLTGRQLGEALSFERAGDGFAGGLAPPAFRRFVFEHGVEVVHPDKTEFFWFSIDERRKDATRAADGTVGDHDRGVTEGISDLVMIPDDLDGIGFCLVIDDEPDYEAVFAEGMMRAIGEGQGMWLMEHLVGFEAVVEVVEQHRIKRGDEGEADRGPAAFPAWCGVGVASFCRMDQQRISNQDKPAIRSQSRLRSIK